MPTRPRPRPPLGNIPLANLRDEFAMTMALFQSRDFRRALSDHARPIRTPLLDWHDRAESFLTLLVQRSILGLEAYIEGAVWITLSELGRLTTDLNAKVRDPFSLKGRGTAENMYDKLPALIDPALGMQTSDLDLYEEVKDFYRNVRNPLLHGQEFSSPNIQEAYRCLQLVKRVYAWVDQWHGPAPPASFVLMGTFATK